MGNEVEWLCSLHGRNDPLGHDIVGLHQDKIKMMKDDWSSLLKFTQYKNIDFETLIHPQKKVGRNGSFPCEGGNKYKKYCNGSQSL